MNQRFGLLIGSALLLTACSGGTDRAATTTTVTQLASPTSTLIKSPRMPEAGDSKEQGFVSSLTMFSGYWAMQDADDLVALGETTCASIGMKKAKGMNPDQIIPLVAVEVQQSFGSNPPTMDDAESFANSSVNFLCNELVSG